MSKMIEDYVSSRWEEAESVREEVSGWVVSTEYGDKVYVSIQEVMEWMYENQLKFNDNKGE